MGDPVLVVVVVVVKMKVVVVIRVDPGYFRGEDGFWDLLDDTESMEDDDFFWDEYLDEDEEEKTLLQMYPFKDSFVEEKVYLKEKEFQKHLEKELKAVATSTGQLSISSRSPVPSTSYVGVPLLTVTDHDQSFTTSRYPSWSRLQIFLRDQSSQTEWPYKSKLGSESFINGTILSTLMNETFDKNQEETLESISNSYDSMFMEILSELAVHHKLEEDLDMPPSKVMMGNSKRKLGILLKKSFEKYRQTLLWIVKKRRGSEAQTTASTPSKTLRHGSHLQKEHEGDGQSIPYHSGIPFNLFFPDGTGQIYYPSGNLALLISYSSVTKVTYIVLEDCVETKICGFANSSGHVTFNDETGKLWLSLSKILGYYFPKNKPHKAWNWWNLSLHVHAPPVVCITLELNKYIHIEVKSQDTVMFYFCSPKQKRICFNMGSRFKSVRPKLLQAMKKKSVLETDPHPMSWKIQALLGKISRQLSLSTLSELEDFIAVTQVALEDLNANKSRLWS
ncbi:glutamate-rich protein 6B [Meriones unguiculatus]|uniref:glutamate-rich protein 6B n=1 Tax=Meriones unguiculatus TaxID=10047 RepID=UPI00293EFC55|nr:glutamate-rich protein 6B [Meriones unguiculatus]